MDYSLKTLKELNFEKYFLDIGTGDGRYVYKTALLNPQNLYIGIDPSSNLKEYQRQINRKKLGNALLINVSIENFNPTGEELFDEITIILPWGNLLKYVVTADRSFYEKISHWLKPTGALKVIFGFNEELEEKQTKRLNLKDLNEKEMEYLKEQCNNLSNLKLKEFKQITYLDLMNVDTSWSKKLSFGKNRNYIYLELKKI